MGMNPKNKKSIKINSSKKYINKSQKIKSEQNKTTSKKKSEQNKTTSEKKKTTSKKKLGIIVLDLDETLLHTKGVNIFYRPYVKKFISFIHKYFYLVVYTAALKTYADNILIDLFGEENMKKIFILKLYRNSLTNNGKDLKLVINKIIE